MLQAAAMARWAIVCSLEPSEILSLDAVLGVDVGEAGGRFAELRENASGVEPGAISGWLTLTCSSSFATSFFASRRRFSWRADLMCKVEK